MTATNSEVVPLHGSDYAPTRLERELFERVWAKCQSTGEPIPMTALAAELVALGVPTIDRATDVVAAHFAPGGLPPLDQAGKPSLAWLVQKHASSMAPDELLALILRHHPETTIPDIVAELKRQAALDNAEADALAAHRR